MLSSKKPWLTGLLAALALGAATLAQAQDTCPPGTSAGQYCASNSNPKDPAPTTRPKVQPAQAGKAPGVGGTLNGGSQTVEVSSSSNEPGYADVIVNLAGTGTLVIRAGDQTITITITGDGTTTIDPGNGQKPIVITSGGSAPGTLEIRITPTSVTYILQSPGSHTVRIGNAVVTVPGTATISSEDGNTTYRVDGSGNCTAGLDPSVSNHITTADEVACTISEGTRSRSLRSFRKGAGADIIRTGNLRDRIAAGPGTDVIRSRGGNDRVHGGSASDFIRGGRGNDQLFGDGGSDAIYGGAGRDGLHGGAGRDRIVGGGGNDVIYVRGHGRDRVTCGGGRDTVFASRNDRVARDCERVLRAR